MIEPSSAASSASPRPVRVRVAPSPTGDPHVGTAYIGLLNYLFAAQRGGKFVLRIEDTDRTRFVPTSEQMIFDSLRWIGLEWNEGPDVGGPYGPYRQSERTEIYREYAEKLLANGSAYRAFETPEELDAERKAQLAAKQPPKYGGRSRNLSQAEIDANLAAGKPFTVRLKVPTDGSTTFRDELRGDITFDHFNVDDQVLLKSDGFPTYHLANVVDDHLMQITDVIRAEEWISSTPKHVLLYQAFGWELPRFWHMPLLRNADKSKISKRKNPVSLNYYRDAGFLPPAMLNFLGLMGGGMPQPTEQEIVSKGLDTKQADLFTLSDMLERFDFSRISLGGPVFDLVKLRWMNGEYLRKLSPDEFFAAMRATVFSDAYLKAIAPLVQTRIDTLGRLRRYGRLLLQGQRHAGGVRLGAEEAHAGGDDHVRFGPAHHPRGRDLGAPRRSKSDMKKLGEEKGWSVKENFMLLRAIITGSTQSPPLMDSLLVFGKARSIDRVRRFIEAQRKRK